VLKTLNSHKFADKETEMEALEHNIKGEGLTFMYSRKPVIIVKTQTRLSPSCIGMDKNFDGGPN
jgi:hypothetical protein